MYRLSRWMLELAVMIAAYSLFLTTLLSWPWAGLFIGGLGIAAIARRGQAMLTTLGSARWANERELKRHGLLNSDAGLILGHIPIAPRRLPHLSSLFWINVPPKEACERFWTIFQRGRVALVRAASSVHIAVFAPTGAGKGRCCILPFLFDCKDSCLAVDPKGENANITAEYRRQNFGHRIVYLDPFRIACQNPDSFNALDQIKADDPLAIDKCLALANSLIVRTADEKDPHWNDSAEALLAAMLAMVVRYGEPEMRSLQTVRDLLSNPERIDMALQAMRESDAWDGMLARMGGQLAHMVDRERSSVLSTLSRHLRFLDTPAIAASTSVSSFDPAELLQGKMTIFLILPPEQLRSQASLLRMWINAFLKTVVTGGLNNERNIHFVLDEASSLNHLESLEDAIDKYRGFGVKLQFYYQSVAQLKKCFPNGQDQNLLSNCTQIFFGTNDVPTADLVSTRLGEQTIIVKSGGASSGNSWQKAMNSGETSSFSTNNSSSWQQQARKLLKPEEVIALPPRVAITFIPGVLPVWTELVRYDEQMRSERPSTWVRRTRHALGTFLASLGVLMLSVAVAVVLSVALCKAFPPRL